MSDTQFAMVSKWMPNGNINEFVKAHCDANRFELVSFPFGFPPPLLLVDHYMFFIAGRYHEGLDFCAQSGNGPRRSQGGTFSRVTVTFSLTFFR
jgi:hypothetical protein